VRKCRKGIRHEDLKRHKNKGINENNNSLHYSLKQLL
jgi:hypothetical protein